MPIPQPKKNEPKDDYISRCIAKISDEYDANQAAAICYNNWKNKDRKKKTNKTEKD